MHVEQIQSPYWFDAENLPGLDFNREVIEPGINETFLKGAVGIRVDDDFWVVAVLPPSWKDEKLEDIVALLWPEYRDEAKFCPDHGTIEQKIYYAELFAKQSKDENDRLHKLVWEQSQELKRLRSERDLLAGKWLLRKSRENEYFIQQYERLLIALAHEAKPYDHPDKGGICSLCNLLTSDRIHNNKFIMLRAKGFDPCNSFKFTREGE